jgi:hypothetical protein
MPVRSAFGQAQEQALMRPTPDIMRAPAAAPAAKEIPYDYVAKFTLLGTKRGNRVQDVINISVEGAFVAAAIGYSFIPADLAAVPLSPIPVTLGGVPQPAASDTSLPEIFAENIAGLLTYNIRSTQSGAVAEVVGI